MAQNHPTVQEGRLVYQLDGRTQEIILETSEWYTWLDIASMFTFRSTIGTFTARKERAGNKRGGWYWKAYRKHTSGTDLSSGECPFFSTPYPAHSSRWA